MFLGTTKGSANIPEEGIKVTKEEALIHQRNLIENWPSVTEVFFLRFGRHITTAATFICSAASINVFHPLLKFGRGTITAVVPAIALPTALVYYKTDNVLTNEILTLKMDCPLCYHLKFLALQLYGSIAFPGLLGMLNTNLGYGVPFSKTDSREYWRKTFEITQTHKSTFQRIFLIQIILALAVPYIQNSEITKIMKQLVENPGEKVSEGIS